MTRACPFCGSEYERPLAYTHLSGRQRDIYEAVVAAGPRGLSVPKLLAVVYGSDVPKSGWGVLRVAIFEINRKIAKFDQKIKGRRSIGYVLTSDSDIRSDAVS